MSRKKTVDDYLIDISHWQDELLALRRIILSTNLTETIKWGMPCYTYGGKNIVGMAGFKSYFGLWFHQGVFLNDPAGVLINAQAEKTKTLRQWRMTAAGDIKAELIKEYISESIEHSLAGKAMPKSAPRRLKMPPLLETALIDDAELRAKFEAFRTAQQCDFADYISSAKQAATKQKRVEKIIPLIQAGTGLNDKYK
ncbi:YdeI/OmpD-associated family protein [Hellea balneolensis]|uniref:YdeI/OmpD-associated family protein n=1 Tax=Hellea balneolensis TaxID=287478 RepID=UPI0003FF1E4A|nr:DUF1801 domain-containing protein [Hellea balneolensis]